MSEAEKWDAAAWGVNDSAVAFRDFCEPCVVNAGTSLTDGEADTTEAKALTAFSEVSAALSVKCCPSIAKTLH